MEIEMTNIMVGYKTSNVILTKRNCPVVQHCRLGMTKMTQNMLFFLLLFVYLDYLSSKDWPNS